MSNLKACPCCGEAKRISQRSKYPNGHGPFIVECKSCGINTGWNSVGVSIAAWETRSDRELTDTSLMLAEVTGKYKRLAEQYNQSRQLNDDYADHGKELAKLFRDAEQGEGG